jgi:hypothetical protein
MSTVKIVSRRGESLYRCYTAVQVTREYEREERGKRAYRRLSVIETREREREREKFANVKLIINYDVM